MRPALRWTLGILATVVAVYGIIYVDVVLRAKQSYAEGEKYWNWTDHPDEAKRFYDERWSREKIDLEKKLAKSEISKDDYDREIELGQFEHDQQVKESTIKYAYLWYQTTVELFSPPESKWVRLARQKMPSAKERWKAELRSKNIPFEDYMID